MFAAARTNSIAIGTSMLNLPWYNPTLLARRIASIDVLSEGRLRVGLGIGWSPDEYGGFKGSPYSNGLVAVDGHAGAVHKHYQINHHDLYDYNPPSHSIL